MRKKQIFCILAIITFCFTVANAQKVSVEGGFTIAQKYGNGISSTFMNGNRAGLLFKIKEKKNVSLLTGVLYTVVYSDKLQSYPNSKSVSYYTNAKFLDIPLQVRYTLPLFKNVKVFAAGGPNLNVGLYQSQTIISSLSSISTSVTNLYHNGSLNRFNLQMGLSGGIQWKKFQIKSGYDWGLNNINKSTGNNVFQRGWNISLGYEF